MLDEDVFVAEIEVLVQRLIPKVDSRPCWTRRGLKIVSRTKGPLAAVKAVWAAWRSAIALKAAVVQRASFSGDDIPRVSLCFRSGRDIGLVLEERA